jgi:hypothetical protein
MTVTEVEELEVRKNELKRATGALLPLMCPWPSWSRTELFGTFSIEIAIDSVA